MTLYQKLALSLFSTFVLVVGTCVLIIQSLESISRDKAEQELHQELAAHLVHDNPLLSSGQHDQQALENLFHSMMILGQNFEFYVLDQSGKILTYSAKPGEVKRTYVDLEPIQWLLENQMSLPLYADDPRSDKQKIFSVAPIESNGKTRGYLYVIIGGQIYDSIFSAIKNNEQLQLIGILAGASLLFLFVLLLLSFRFFVKPLKKLTGEVKQLNIKTFNGELPKIEINNTSGEVAKLSQVFNQLIQQVNQQFLALESVDKDRRELLAHLSHDLRTPLSSLQGFLETINLKQQDISETEGKQYIERCLKNAKSLKGFVDQIFELAHLDSGEISVTKEAFPLADLLYDMVDKFAISASRKQIQLNVELDDEQLMVNTDIAKLERILTNLIENAIRHTPAQGNICLCALSDGRTKQVSLSIRDDGTGLNLADIPFLFEPRFRGEQAINDGNRHIGLGLTITRKLVKVLGSEIKASNNPDGGANFRFDLPIMA